MRILRASSSHRFVGPVDAPHQLVFVEVQGEGSAEVGVDGPGLVTVEPAAVHLAGTARVEVAVGGAATTEVGATIRATARITGPAGTDGHGFDHVVAEPGWRMFMVPHFHYDPVWWNTQAFYTETWEKLPRSARPWEGRKQQPAFTLIDAHLLAAARDPDYRFVLAELDYLKPYWDTFPWRREELTRLLLEGRLELVGGTYNEPNTNLTSAESTARNAIYGTGYQRDVLGGDPATAWQLDAFGHDPQFPGLMAEAGLTSSSWARGPFHQWGPSRSPGGNTSMQFPSEFEWVAPSGLGLLTSYMPNHYSAGWDLDAAPDLEGALAEADRLFSELAPVAATRNVLLPVGSDYTPPNRWVTEIQREWNARYTWPRFEVAVPRDFFAAVRAELRQGARRARPQTRDMNPIYTGKDVSYIDTKQAQRAGENLLLAAERFATFASVLGARYPAEATDKAWRQLLFGAHHDGITGTESDQVYLDLLGGWRETYELAREVLDASLAHLGRHIDTSGAGEAVVVFNGLSWSRTDVVSVRWEAPSPAGGLRLLDETGAEIPFAIEAVERDAAGLVTAATVVFVAREVPSIGYRTYRLVSAPDVPPASGWEAVAGTTIGNDRFEVRVDPDRGGAIDRIHDRRDGVDVLRPGELGNEVIAYEEYPTHPVHGEGPWHLTPTGASASSADGAAEVVAERSAIGRRLRVLTEVAGPGGGGGAELTQLITLFEGVDRVVCTTQLDAFTGQDTLFRVRFAADVPGGLPVHEVGDAVVGRGAGFPDVDVASVPYTLDNPAYGWFGVGTTARVDLAGPHGPPTASRSIAVAEVVGPDTGSADPSIRSLVVALVRTGVTSTSSSGSGPRYGAMDTDSNLPDVRISVGGPGTNSFTAEVLAAADPRYRATLDRQLRHGGSARLWVPAMRPLAEVWRPDADLRGPRALPVLILAGTDERSVAAAVQAVTDELAARQRVLVRQPIELHAEEGQAAERTVGLLNLGLPGCNVDVRGSLHLSLMRSCSGWPSGVWLDPPRRTVPDGSSFQFQHWTHRFEYALATGAGDWRRAGLVRAGHEHNQPLQARVLDPHPGALPARASLLHPTEGEVVISAVKPAGNPLARLAPPEEGPTEAITVRCYEPHGRTVETFLAFLAPVVAGARTDLLEEATTPLVTADGRLPCRLAPYEVATLRARLQLPASAIRPTELGPRREPAQPVFGDHWLHNKGAAPSGYQPVTVRIQERAVRTDGAFTIGVTVAAARTVPQAAGWVQLVLPDGWAATPAERSYHLAAGAYDTFPVEVVPVATPGRWFVAARIVDGSGQEHEDVVTVDVSDAPLPDVLSGHRRLYLERGTRRAAIVDEPADPDRAAAIGEELRVTLPTDRLRVGPGERSAFPVRLDNTVAGTIRGEAQLVSPWGTWEALWPWSTGFEVGGGSSTTLTFELRCPVGMPPTSAWALVKVMYYGRLHYTATVPIELAVQAPSTSWSHAAASQ
jgi:alpha-mannosidase